MIRFLLKKFVPDYTNTSDKLVRERYSVLSGVVGIACNFFLFLVKVITGLMMNSIAILSDGFNNLSDIGSSVVSVIGAKMSNKEPDHEHPFGHGRIEYIASLVVSFLIMLVGFELLKSSVQKIITPQNVTFSFSGILFLLLSVLGKLWMYSYNRYLGNQIQSGLLLATAKDSLNDVISTLAVIASAIAGVFLPFSIDGYVGAIVSLMILYSGFSIAKDTISLLLGTPPEKETVDQLATIILSGKSIVGMHDLIVHNYGPGRVMASVHAEVSSDADMIAVHEEIDELEQQASREMGIMLVIHMDPVLINCERTAEFRRLTEKICKQVNPEFTIHDFRITDGENRINLIFDLVVPHAYSDVEKKSVLCTIEQLLRQQDERIRTVIQIDTLYI